MFMNKRGFIGEDLFLYLFYLILATLIGGILIVFALDLRDDAAFKMKGTSIDSSLLVDAISVSKNDLNIKLTYPEERFLIKFSQNPCLVRASRLDKLNYVDYRCFSLDDFQEKEIEMPFLEINKEKNNLEIK